MICLNCKDTVKVIQSMLDKNCWTAFCICNEVKAYTQKSAMIKHRKETAVNEQGG